MLSALTQEEQNPIYQGDVTLGPRQQTFALFMHRFGGVLIVEFEAPVDSRLGLNTLYPMVRVFIEQLHQAETVDAIAGRGGKVIDGRLTVQPVGKEGRDHVIAHGEFADPSAHRLYHPGAIGHGNAPIGGRHLAQHHAQVMEIQRAGLDPYADLASPRLPGIGQFAGLQLVQTTGFA